MLCALRLAPRLVARQRLQDFLDQVDLAPSLRLSPTECELEPRHVPLGTAERLIQPHCRNRGRGGERHGAVRARRQPEKKLRRAFHRTEDRARSLLRSHMRPDPSARAPQPGRLEAQLAQPTGQRRVSRGAEGRTEKAVPEAVIHLTINSFP